MVASVWFISAKDRLIKIMHTNYYPKSNDWIHLAFHSMNEYPVFINFIDINFLLNRCVVESGFTPKEKCDNEG